MRVESLFAKALGAIYAIAFWSLAMQIGGLAGSRGILPAQTYLSRISEVYGVSKYWTFPTLFWMGSSDFALKLACWAGVFFSMLIIAGIFQRVSLILCWMLYLSLTTIGQDFLNFQWDILLLEAGFLAILLGFSPVVIWLFRWLLFRLMLMSGAVKLLSGDPTWKNLSALQFHYQTQPLPTPIAWYAQQLPGWFQHASVVFMFAIEFGAPFLIFAPRYARLFGGAAIVLLQVLILLSGNYTFFNWLTMALCIPLLAETNRERCASVFWRRVTVSIAGVLVTISGIQMVSQFVSVPAVFRYPERVLSPWNLTNSYGLFAVMTTVRHEIVLEGSNDGSTWTEYEFKYKPGDVRQAPRWIAPLQPRLDWQMWFAALGGYRSNPWFVNFVLRLLEGSPEVVSLLARDPLAGHPPRYVRALVYDYSFTDWRSRDWWKRELKGIYLPSVSLEMFQRSE